MITTLILLVLSAVLGFAAGFFAGVKNAQSSKVLKAKEVLDTIKK